MIQSKVIRKKISIKMIKPYILYKIFGSREEDEVAGLFVFSQQGLEKGKKATVKIRRNPLLRFLQKL